MFSIFITNECNFRCSYCYEQYTDKPYVKSEITFDTLDKIYNFIIHYILVNQSEVKVYIMGGECLLYFEKIKYIIEKLSPFNEYIIYYICTNGLLLKEKINDIKELNKLKDIKLFVKISYDFYLQDKQRKNNTYHIVRENIKLVLKNHINVITFSIIDGLNNIFIDKVYDDYAELYDSLDEQEKSYYYRAFFNFNIIDCKNFDFSVSDKFQYLKEQNDTNKRLKFEIAVVNMYDKSHNNTIFFIHFTPEGICYYNSIYIYQLYENNEKDTHFLGDINKNSYNEILKNYEAAMQVWIDNKDVATCEKCPAGDICRKSPWAKMDLVYCKILNFILPYMFDVKENIGGCF